MEGQNVVEVNVKVMWRKTVISNESISKKNENFDFLKVTLIYW